MLWLWIACVGSEKETPFEVSAGGRLEPIEELKLDAPPPNSTEQVAWISGDEGDYAWVHLRGFLATDLDGAWSALRQPEVFIDMREIDDYTIAEVDDPQYDYVYDVHNVVHDILTVEFDVQWRHAGEYEEEILKRVGVRWQKVAGTPYIASLQGSVQIIPAQGTEQLVEVQVIEHLTATLDQEDNAIQYVTDLYARWNAIINGDPLPTYD